MSWVESHQSLSRHRKTIRAVTLLKVDRHKFIGHLHEMWWWALDNVGPDGNMGGVSSADIAHAAGWPEKKADEFRDALLQVGFIDDEGGVLFLHDWYEYAGKLLVRRAANKRRMKDARAAHMSDTNDARVVATVPNRTEPLSNERGSASRYPPVDDPFKEEMVTKYRHVPRESVLEAIEDALAHKSADKWKAKQRYVQGWLRRSFPDMPQSSTHGPTGQTVKTHLD